LAVLDAWFAFPDLLLFLVVGGLRSKSVVGGLGSAPFGLWFVDVGPWGKSLAQVLGTLSVGGNL